MRRSRHIATVRTGAMLLLAIGLTASPAGARTPATSWLVQPLDGGCVVQTVPMPSRAYGSVTVAPAGSSTSVTVQILRGVPNERYTVNVTCVGSVGDVYTNASGRGSARIVIDRPLPFAIDVHLHCTSGDCAPRFAEGARTEVLSFGH